MKPLGYKVINNEMGGIVDI